jgi:hypothetical protein
MAKAAKKTPAGKAGKKGQKPATTKVKSGKANQKKSTNQLTWLAKSLLGMTFLWFLIAGYFASSDLMARRASCLDWLVQESRSVQGYKRVFNTDSVRLGCSVQKLGLRGFIAEPPIYPNLMGLALLFLPPAGMMGFVLLAFKFRRGLILHQKKKVWAKAGPLDLDDFEDTRDLPSEEDIQEMEEAEARENMTAAESMNEALEEAAKKTAGPDKTKSAKQAPKQAGKPQPEKAKPAPEPEKPEEELSELEKILRQVDD